MVRGWVGGQNFGALRCSGQPGPRPSALKLPPGIALCTRRPGPTLSWPSRRVRAVWASEKPRVPSQTGSTGTGRGAPSSGSLGRGPSPEEVGKLKCRRTRRPTPGPWARGRGRAPQLPSTWSPHPLSQGPAWERGLRVGGRSPQGTPEAGGRALSWAIIRLCAQALQLQGGCLPGAADLSCEPRVGEAPARPPQL